MDKYREQWENLGADDPYWAVLTLPGKRGGKWSNDEFFNTGKKEIDNILEKISSLKIQLNLDKGTALDFGCGVGRLSRALAAKFKKVVAVDVSSSMLEEAKKVNRDIKQIEFIHNTEEHLKVIPKNSIDFLYSNIVLQHMPKNKQVQYIKEFCNVLSLEGVIAIQTPSQLNLKSLKGWVYLLLGNRVLNIIRKLKHGPNGVMEVHTLSKDTIVTLLNQQGMEIIDVSRYDSTGPGFKSYMYIAKKIKNEQIAH